MLKFPLPTAGLLLALSLAAHAQTPATTDKAHAATPPATSSKPAPKRDLNEEAMKGMGSSRSTMSEEESKQRRAEKAQKQADRAKMKAEEAQKKADAAKMQAEEAHKKAAAAKK